MRLLSVALCLSLPFIAGQAYADGILYSNGTVDGQTNAVAITGFRVADSFTLASTSTISEVNFWVWASPGDTPLSVDWAFTSGPLLGTTFGSGSANLTSMFLSTNVYGYDIYRENFSIPGITLGHGSYWFQLSNGSATNGDPLYWDVNNGPSAAYQEFIGNLAEENDTGSEAFQLLDSPSSPEPATFALLGLGMLLLGVGSSPAGRGRVSRQ